MKGIVEEVPNHESVTEGGSGGGEEDVSDFYDAMVGGFGMLPGTARSFSSGWNTGLTDSRKHPHHFSITSPAPIHGSKATAHQVDNAVLKLDLGSPVPFNLCGELFHVFISYRVNTEGADGNSFASKLYHQLQMQSNGDDEFNIPAAGIGKYPRFARELPPGIANKPNVAKVYLDTECLQDGQEWMVGFVRGLALSIVAVLLVSWSEDGEGSIGKLCSLKEESEDVDNVLLEWIIALELKAHPSSSVKAIMPMVFDSFNYKKCHMLPNIVARKTNQTAAVIMRKLGVPEDQITVMESKTVRQIVNQVLAHQGILVKVGDEAESVSDAAKRVLKSCQREIRMMSSSPETFVSVRPMGQEVLEWLEENVLDTYAPILAANGLDNLFTISRLENDQIMRLAEDHRTLYCQTDVKPLMGDYTDLRRVIHLLERDERARLLVKRLDEFRDPKVSALGMLARSNSMELIASKTAGQISFIVIVAGFFGNTVLQLVNLISRAPGYTLEGGVEHSETLEDPQAQGTLNLEKLIRATGLLVCSFCAEVVLLAIYFRYLSPRKAIMYAFRLAMVLATTFVCGGIASLAQCSVDEDVRAHDSFAQCQNMPFALFTSSLLVWLALLVKYRQEHVVRAALALVSVLWFYFWGYNDRFSFDLGRPVFNIFIWVTASVILVALQVGEFAAKRKADRLANNDIQSYRRDWSEFTGAAEGGNQNLKDLEELAERVDEKASALEQEYKDHLSKLSYFERLLFFLRTRDERFASKKGAGSSSFKVRQVNKDLDLLISHAALINVPFQNYIDSLLSQVFATPALDCDGAPLPSKDRDGAVCHLPLYLKRGPVKKPERAIEKVVRSYRRDVGSLTDLVRCTIMVDGCKELLHVWEAISEKSVVSICSSGKHGDKSENKMFRLVGVKNRFKADYDDRESAGYRNMSISVEVGWEVVQGAVVFKPVSNWGSVKRHICELQVHLTGINGDHDSPEKHRNYVEWRNTLTR